MHIVWHGHYMSYFEDAREAFGRAYGLDYLTIFHEGYYVPLVDISLQYKRPIVYGMTPQVTVTYIPTDAAKIIFEYQIHDPQTCQILATGRSVQVFMDMRYQLVWGTPPFYEQWKKKWL